MNKYAENFDKIDWSGARPAVRRPKGEVLRKGRAYSDPLNMQSMRVRTYEAAEHAEEVKRAGLRGIEVNPKTGEVHARTRGARKRYLAHQGYCDLDGGYGD